MEQCSHCGVCVDTCYFGARKMENDELQIISENCYGCGLCVDDCGISAISMIKRSV
jgi:Fe-S-cluster-containing hydrogenase component 2